MKSFSLFISGLIFAAIAVAHFYRYTKAYAIQVHEFTVPMDWSLYGGVAFAVLALWMFVAAKK